MSLQWFKSNASGFSGEMGWDEPLSKYTWYRIGGPADLLLTPKSETDLHWISKGLRESKARYFILGAGSNLLVSDAGFRGVVIRANRFSQETASVTPSLIRAGGSVLVSSLLRRAAQEGWGGLEFLSGIPGTLGGVVRMNGGTHLGEAKDRLQKVKAVSLLSGETFEYRGSELRMEYRKNLFLPADSLVVETEWSVQPVSPAEVKSKLDEVLTRRKSTQPIDQPSCGSVFKNPKEHGLSAWQVVDQLGLRGYRMGGAEFSQKHSNFIVNLGGAKAVDVRSLIELAKAKAFSEMSIRLEEEVLYLGF